jgi:hypothetical protein
MSAIVSPLEPEAYADWMNLRIGAEVLRRREALGSVRFC